MAEKFEMMIDGVGEKVGWWYRNLAGGGKCWLVFDQMLEQIDFDWWSKVSVCDCEWAGGSAWGGDENGGSDFGLDRKGGESRMFFCGGDF
jgi:hypothetical protein